MPNQNFSPELTPEMRFRALEDNADFVEEGEYAKQLTKEELDFIRERMGDDMVSLSVLKDEFDKIKQAYKDKMSPLQEAISENLNSIKTGQEKRIGKQFYFKDFTTSMVTAYDVEGQFILTRRMFPNERQSSIMTIKRNDNE